jgi:hypothetical protein
MRLTDLEPSWFTIGAGRHGMGLTFLCPVCRTQHLGIWFANPLDGGEPAPPNERPYPRWKRTGDTFETMTLAPSVDASVGDKSCTPAADGTPRGHWHGHIIDGAIAGGI